MDYFILKFDARFDAKTVYQALAVVLLALLWHNLRPKQKIDTHFPVWATLEIAIGTYVIRGNGLGHRIFTSIRKYGGSLFGISSTHQLLINLPDVDRLMSQPAHTINTEPIVYALFLRVFGGEDSPEMKQKTGKSWKDLRTPIERLFLNETAVSAAMERASVPQKAASFVTFSSSRADMKRWEVSADMKLISKPVAGRPGIVEANLQSLTRDFGACISISLLFGQDFLDRCPSLLDDFWKFDTDVFPLLVIGVPEWAPFRMMREGIAARSRILRELEGLSNRMDQHQRGENVDFGVDMTEIDNALFERNEIHKRDGWSFKERAVDNFVLLWGQNANTHTVLFWLLAYVYSTPGLLERIREETGPYIQISDASPHDIASIDITALSRNCPLLKSSIFETYRKTLEPTAIRHVERPITVNDGAFNHELQPGTFISAPLYLVNHDPKVFADPEKFIPDRFLETDEVTGKQTARYGKLRPWGIGTGICKGRTFAERELVALSAALISLWDISPAAGTWQLPAVYPGTGVKRVATDIRVRIAHRKF